MAKVKERSSAEKKERIKVFCKQLKIGLLKAEKRNDPADISISSNHIYFSDPSTLHEWDKGTVIGANISIQIDYTTYTKDGKKKKGKRRKKG